MVDLFSFVGLTSKSVCFLVANPSVNYLYSKNTFDSGREEIGINYLENCLSEVVYCTGKNISEFLL